MRDDDDTKPDMPGSEDSNAASGYASEGPAGRGPHANTSKLSRHTTRVLPTPIVLKAEHRRLANSPKCGKRGAITALAKKYKVSQSAVKKALEKKRKRMPRG